MLPARIQLVEELYGRYGKPARGVTAGMRWKLFRKRFLWNTVVSGATLAKRLLDIVVSASALLALSPLFAFVALAIKLTDHGPVLFWQSRVGQWGKEFPFPKFRSMVVNAEQLKAKLAALNDHKSGVTFKMKNDPRITWIGRIIRKLSIDELPQLWCVLEGKMSLVGPRPPLPKEVAQYTLLDRRRLDVKPGLTCIWQVSGRGDIAFAQQVELDVQYIQSQSVWFDLVLLFKTIPAILTGRGAY
jgi:lipopolysaccharide/colanic/teichoic acid biosynthesis glycosyltransferase